jgi:hypothetical protein
MSAIYRLKNLAIAITGNLFSPSKNKRLQKNIPLRTIPRKKKYQQPSREMSDFTIL